MLKLEGFRKYNKYSPPMFTPFYVCEFKVGIESRLANEATFTTTGR